MNQSCLRSAPAARFIAGPPGDFRNMTRATAKQLWFMSEYYHAESDALRREQYLKTTKGKRTLRLMLRDTLARHDV